MNRTGPGARQDWIDLLRGVACALVVLNHSIGSAAAMHLPGGGLWAQMARLGDGFRMPVFFFVCGLLATEGIRRSWRDVFLKRAAPLIWMYLLWGFLHIAVHFAAFNELTVERLLGYLFSLALPNQDLWFLWALALYSILARATRGVPSWILISPCVGLHLVVYFNLVVSWTSNAALAKAVSYLVFFLLATRIKGTVMAWRAISRRTAVAVVGGCLGLVVLEELLSDTLQIHVPLVVGLMVTFTGLLVAKAVQGAWWTSPIIRLGRLTLPVYCTHFVVLQTVPTLLGLTVPSLFGWAWPLALAVTALTFSLLLHRVTERVPGLWKMPTSEHLRRPVLLRSNRESVGT